MAQASPTPSSSLGSILAEALARSAGVHSSISATHLSPVIRALTASRYTKQVQKEASDESMWGPAAKILNVSINDRDQVRVTAVGDPDEITTAMTLEYGTPDSPPRAVMRTYEAAFTEDYNINKGKYSL